MILTVLMGCIDSKGRTLVLFLLKKLLQDLSVLAYEPDHAISFEENNQILDGMSPTALADLV